MGDVVEEPFLSSEDFEILEKDRKPKEQSLAGLVEKGRKAWDLIGSGVLLPDSLKGHPYTRPTLIGVGILFLVLPIKLYLLLVTIGVLIGGMLVERESGQTGEVAQVLKKRLDGLSIGKDSDSETFGGSTGKLKLTPKIDEALDVFLDRLVRSLIDPWYLNQNKSGSREFQSCVRGSIDAALVALRKTVASLGKDSMTLYLYGLTNALNVHMQEYKAFCKSGAKDGKAYLLSSAALRAYHGTSVQAEVAHFKQLVTVLLRRLLPRQEVQSLVLVGLLKEVIASGALWNAMDRLCDPDFINMKIVEALREPPADLTEKLSPGWNVVVLKIIKGKELPVTDAGGLYCMVHIAGHKVRTRRVSGAGSAIWNEAFQFRVSDAVLGHLRMHVQLLQYSYVGQDSSLGYVKVQPEQVATPTDAKQHWLRFKTGEVFVETYILSGSQQLAQEKPPSIDEPIPESVEKQIRVEDLTLEGVLRDNELFMSLYDWMQEQESAPSYLPFLMGYEALRQFSAMELGLDPSVPEAIENYFRRGQLEARQKEQLLMLKTDALELYQRFFSHDSKMLDPGEEMRSTLQAQLRASDRVDEAGRFAGGSAIGPNAFISVQKWVYERLRSDHFPAFIKQLAKQGKLDMQVHLSQQLTIGETPVSGGEEALSELDSSSTMLDHGSSSIDHATQSAAQMDIQKISTTIALHKQQLAALEDRLERTKEPSERDRLLKTRRELEKQVQSLLGLARSIESEGDQVLGEVGEHYWVDLRDATVYLQPSTDLGDGVYDLRIARQELEDEETLAVISKTFTDFERLHKDLRKAFPKLEKVPLPPSSDPAGLQSYLHLLIMDEWTRQSPVLRQFLSLDSDLAAVSASPAAMAVNAAGQLVQAVVGKRMKSALSSMITSGVSASRTASPKTKFYETREHHTTTELRDSTANLAGGASLHRSRSISSFLRTDEALTRNVSTTALSMPATPVKNRPTDTSHRGPASSKKEEEVQVFSVPDLSDADIDMLMETVYAFITETFDLRETNQWIRRKVLSLSKQLLRQAYSDTLSRSATSSLNAALSEPAILRHIEALTRLLWPNGIFIKDVPPPLRTADQQLATQIEARSLFLNNIPDGLERLAGRLNSVNGMTRIFELLQQKDFNKILFTSLLDITLKILFAEQSS